jgi:hypothetical protein
MGESTFLPLPGEGRFRIYAHVSIDGVYKLWDNDQRLRCCLSTESYMARSLGLLQVSRKIYNEASLLPFALNEFCCLTPKVFEKLRLHFDNEQRAAIGD